MNPEIASTPTLVCSVIFIVVLIVAVVLLILGIRKQRKAVSMDTLSQSSFPFPQRQNLPTGLIRPGMLSGEEMNDKIRLAYREWLEKYLLPDQEPGRAFLRSGVEKHWLRYQVTGTSFGQGLALLISILMAGDDLGAQSRFDRLVAFCLAHPSANSAELMSWQVMPDVVPGKRLEADPHSEAWMVFALIAALSQWQESDRFHYSIIAREKLTALLPLYESTTQTENSTEIHSPYFFKVFEHATGNPDWKRLSGGLEKRAHTILADPDARLTGDGSAKEARLALLVLQLGLHDLWQAKADLAGWSSEIELLVRTACADLSAKISPIEVTKEETSGQYSPLALLACCAPAAICLGDQVLVNQLWDDLEQAQTGNNDPIGASLRLLGLLLLSGNTWFAQVSWQELPVPTEEQAAPEGE